MNNAQATIFPTVELSGPVECLGKTFPSEHSRREHYLAILREKLKDPAFCKQPGFPIGEDEDILTMSDPPYYTACPNPFLQDFVRFHGRPFDPAEKYEREPLAADVSESRNDSLYNAHAYHTKVPPWAVMRYVLNYTKPGDMMVDGFCGSGMAGVGAHLCGSPPADVRADMEQEARVNRTPKPEWGVRTCVLSDLSPVASFIAYNYNTPLDAAKYERVTDQFFEAIVKELSWLYETRHTDKVKGRINFTVWSEIFLCPDCSKEVIYVKEALDKETKKVREQFPCPHCGATVGKRALQKKKEQFFDKYTGATYERNSRTPVLINYTVGKDRYEKEPDAADLGLLKKTEEYTIKDFFPSFELPYKHMTHERVKVADYGVHRFHHFFFHRQLISLATMWRLASAETDDRIRNFLLYIVEQCIWGMSIQNRYSPSHFSQVNRYLSGVVYVPSQTSEVSPWYILDGKYDRVLTAVKQSWTKRYTTAISVSPCSHLGIPDASVDYVFTDPPFGENIYYSDLNQLIEAWHRVLTEATNEAIIDQAKDKELLHYQELMRDSFKEYFRVLKPGRWMTVVFHNSHNSVWNAIQEAISSAGFVVADVRILDRQQSSYRQVTGVTAVKKDLVISAYRPTPDLERRFEGSVRTGEGSWEFVTSHLRQLPVFVMKKTRVEAVAERQDYMLYDRMVAFHVQRGFPVPMSLAEFLAGLRQKFPERDNMYFLPGQVSEYDRRRMDVKEVEQLELFVSDERSAIQWVRRQLSEKPTSYRDLQPLYMKEADRVRDKFDQPLELATILEQNFIMDGKSVWRVPDPKKEADLEQLRVKALLKEFQQYLDTKGKLKLVRVEAVRAGFKECWQKGDFLTIVAMAKRLPDALIQNDQTLLMYYDNALMKTEG